MRPTLVACASVVLLLRGIPAGAEPDDSAPPIVEQLLAHAQALDLSAAQVDALEAIRDRRAHTLAALRERLQGNAAPSSVAATQDELTLMQEIGRLQVLSGREALQQLSPAQRRRWSALHAAPKPPPLP